MIENLPERENDWLSAFFSTPNELSWNSLRDGTAPTQVIDMVLPWLRFLGEKSDAPIILPFMRSGKIAGWYATVQGSIGAQELGNEINSWLGPSWLSILDRVSEGSADPMVAILHSRFNGSVYRFKGPDDAAMQAIAAKLSNFAILLEQRPRFKKAQIRPIGTVRSDFETALLVGDQMRAETLITELKQTGRLNEENLRYLDVRLSAGLGFWPRIARDHWLIRTLADLFLPPQILADLIEALYRTFVDPLEAIGDASEMLAVFRDSIAKPYAKLFKSRRGIRTPRVIKAFLLYELTQPKPDIEIIKVLQGFLPLETNNTLFELGLSNEADSGLSLSALDSADEAFDDGQFDRAFEFYLRVTPTRKSISRMVSCVGAIGTDEAQCRFLAVVTQVGPELISTLPQGIVYKIEQFSQAQIATVSSPAEPVIGAEGSHQNAWISWAIELRNGHNLSTAERDAQSAFTNWDSSEFRQSSHVSNQFADIIGGLEGTAGSIVRGAIPYIFGSVFPADTVSTPATRPIASLLFVLIAMDEALSSSDLELLSQLTAILVEQGISSEDYISLMRDLGDVQKRMGSYAYLPWCLDVCELLALLPCPSEGARDARLRFFIDVLGQVSSFAHRLKPQDFLPIQILAKDFCVDAEVINALNKKIEPTEAPKSLLPDLGGKTIGIYTLSDAAGSRAKISLEKLFPGCKVIVNSDLVCTAQLSSLAKGAELFVFAWKSSSHQAFYCVKDALANKDPIWVPGKGTASILRAVIDHFS